MKVTTISYEMKRSNGNYGSDGVTMTAELEAQENVQESLASLRLLADFQLNYERREAEAEKQAGIVADPNASEGDKVKAERFLEKYEGWIQSIELAKATLNQ